MDKKVALQIRNSEPIEEMAKMMSECGFKYVAVAFGDEKPLLSDNWKDHVTEIDNTLKKYGLKCIQTHAPYYNLMLSAEIREEDMEKALLRSIEATKMLGADLCAVHPRTCINKDVDITKAEDRERSLKENIISFTPLVKACEELGVCLGIENLMKYPLANDLPSFYSWIAEDHAELIDKLNSKNCVGIWDFGHANLADEINQTDSIRTLGARIKGTHVHNNGAVDDEHFPPFLPPKGAYYARRTVDWNSVLTALRETGYDGYLTLETVFYFDYPLKPFIQYLYDSVCNLYDILKAE